MAAHAAAPAVDALVGERRDHAGRLADDAGERRDAGLAHVGDQAARAEAADLLVVAEREVDGERQVGGEERRHLRDGQADEALHVGAAAAVEASVLDLGAERIDRPVLAVPRHGVGVAGDDHAGRLARAERREQVRLLRSSSKVSRLATPWRASSSRMSSISARFDSRLTVLMRTSARAISRARVEGAAAMSIGAI